MPKVTSVPCPWDLIPTRPLLHGNEPNLVLGPQVRDVLIPRARQDPEWQRPYLRAPRAPRIALQARTAWPGWEKGQGFRYPSPAQPHDIHL